MSFTGLEPKSFQRTHHLVLYGIGPFLFRTRERIDDREAYGYAIDIGPESPVPMVRSLGITSVSAAVSHYDELLAAVSGWPVMDDEWPSRWPVKSSEWLLASKQEIHFVGPSHEDVFYCLKRLP